ncbi:MAG: hypothetical protein JWP27_1384 [Flaviaesturariibacter sp.]|nr:hypothetical protein [Flaviaesturariibacter sp.]
MKYPQRLLLAAALACSLSSFAQLKSPANASFRSDIQKLVEDYPHGFATYRGATLEKNPQTTEYASKLTPSGAKGASITQYSAGARPVYSFQATMLETEEFEEASRKYKWLYTQLKGMNVRYVVDQYTLQGRYEAPDESKGFSTSTLTIFGPPSPLRKLKVEVSMQFEFPNWKVGLAVFEKEREDEEKGAETDQ